MIQEVLEDVRNIVRDQIAEALLNFTLPQYPPIYDHPSQNQGRADKMIHLPHQQANVISGMPHAFENAIGQQWPLFAPQQGRQMHLPTPPSNQQQTGMQQV